MTQAQASGCVVRAKVTNQLGTSGWFHKYSPQCAGVETFSPRWSLRVPHKCHSQLLCSLLITCESSCRHGESQLSFFFLHLLLFFRFHLVGTCWGCRETSLLTTEIQPACDTAPTSGFWKDLTSLLPLGRAGPLPRQTRSTHRSHSCVLSLDSSSGNKLIFTRLFQVAFLECISTPSATQSQLFRARHCLLLLWHSTLLWRFVPDLCRLRSKGPQVHPYRRRQHR